MEPDTPAPIDDATAIVPESAEDNISLDDFAAKIAGEPAAATAVAEPEPEAPKHGRHRARSQRASTDDIPRIKELTRRLRETEAERDALKSAPPQSGGAPAVPTTDGAGTAPVVQPPAPRAAAPSASLPPVKAARDDPEPDSTKYDDLNKYFRDLALWSGRESIRTAQAEQQKASQAEQQRADEARLVRQWQEQLVISRQKYPDFDAVAFAPTEIPQGSLVDAWIRENKTGQSVLYHLQRNRAELHAMLAMPLLDQVEALSLLSQRLSGSPTAAVVTGAAPRPVAQPVSRPPTPVRTGPMRSAEEPPDPEQSSLSDFSRFHGTPRSRRARS